MKIPKANAEGASRWTRWLMLLAYVDLTFASPLHLDAELVAIPGVAPVWLAVLLSALCVALVSLAVQWWATRRDRHGYPKAVVNSLLFLALFLYLAYGATRAAASFNV